MSLLPFSACRLLLVTGLMVCALTACGRRGTLEPPPDPAVTAQPARQVQDQTVDDEGEELREQIVPSPTPNPPRRRQRGYTIPKEPFILDPLL